MRAGIGGMLIIWTFCTLRHLVRQLLVQTIEVGEAVGGVPLIMINKVASYLPWNSPGGCEQGSILSSRSVLVLRLDDN
jgi:hypothetical protein